jgi:hypothetical protein
LPSRFETAPDRLTTLQSARNAFCLFYDPENQAMASVGVIADETLIFKCGSDQLRADPPQPTQ